MLFYPRVFALLLFFFVELLTLDEFAQLFFLFLGVVLYRLQSNENWSERVLIVAIRFEFLFDVGLPLTFLVSGCKISSMALNYRLIPSRSAACLLLFLGLFLIRGNNGLLWKWWGGGAAITSLDAGLALSFLCAFLWLFLVSKEGGP